MFDPRVEMYLSSKVAWTNCRMRLDFPTLASPRRTTFSRASSGTTPECVACGHNPSRLILKGDYTRIRPGALRRHRSPRSPSDTPPTAYASRTLVQAWRRPVILIYCITCIDNDASRTGPAGRGDQSRDGVAPRRQLERGHSSEHPGPPGLPEATEPGRGPPPHGTNQYEGPQGLRQRKGHPVLEGSPRWKASSLARRSSSSGSSRRQTIRGPAISETPSSRDASTSPVRACCPTRC